MTEKIDVPSLVKEMHEACAELEAAERVESQARGVTSRARNRLNQAQKAIDTALDSIKLAAPRDSDWGQARIHRRSAA